jgi:prepilin-type N-terminal cleavage/methylation domain-containing protein
LRPPRTSPASGFTLLELMVVALIMGTILLLVPPNLDSLGARGKLDSTANSLVAAFNGARERAILDSYEVAVELGTFRDEDGDWRHGWRFRFTNLVADTIADPDAPQSDDVDPEARRDQEREWLYTPWHACGDGVKISGVSEKKDVWKKINEGGKSSDVRFFADGNVENGIAVRLESEDLEVERQYKTVTVLVNPLTSEPSWGEGELELNEARPASDFGN